MGLFYNIHTALYLSIGFAVLGSVSRKILSLEMDLSSLITMVTIVFFHA